MSSVPVRRVRGRLEQEHWQTAKAKVTFGYNETCHFTLSNQTANTTDGHLTAGERHLEEVKGAPNVSRDWSAHYAGQRNNTDWLP